MKELGDYIRDAWIENNPSIRRDRTGFIDNTLYLEALVNNLLGEIPRVYSDDEEEGYEWSFSSSDGDDVEGADLATTTTSTATATTTTTVPANDKSIKREVIVSCSTETDQSTHVLSSPYSQTDVADDGISKCARPTKRRKMQSTEAQS